MGAISWTCPGAWLIAASIVCGLITLGVILRCRRRQARQDAHSLAERMALEHEATIAQESMLQSGQGLLLRFEAIARRLPPGHPIRGELVEALDRAERWLEEGIDRAQHRRSSLGEGHGPDTPS